MCACASGSIEIIEVLLNLGANLFIKSCNPRKYKEKLYF